MTQKVTPDMIDDAVEKESFQHIEDTNVTVCVMLLRNGFSVIGHSACLSDANFDKELGEKIARQHCRDQCWAMFGFQLASEKSGMVLSGDRKNYKEPK